MESILECIPEAVIHKLNSFYLLICHIAAVVLPIFSQPSESFFGSQICEKKEQVEMPNFREAVVLRTVYEAVEINCEVKYKIGQYFH